MTDPQDLIKQSKSICEAATPGPWYLRDTSPCIYTHGPHHIEDEGGSRVVLEDVSKPDGQFISAARTLVPELAKALSKSESVVTAMMERHDLDTLTQGELQRSVNSITQERDEARESSCSYQRAANEYRKHLIEARDEIAKLKGES